MAKDAKEKKADADLACDLVKEFEKLKSNRGNWESHWQEIAERVWSQQSRLFESQGMAPTRGEKRTEHVFDSTAATALNRFGAILDSLLTPRNQTWHSLKPSDEALNDDRETRLWFEQVNRLLFKQRYAPKANFASQNQINYKMLGAYGNGCMFVDKLKNQARDVGLRYRTIHLSQVYFKENHQGIVDTCFRWFKQPARNAYQQFGESCPDDIKAALKESGDREFEFLHVVKPRSDQDLERGDFKRMPYASYYISLSQKQMLDEGGYDTFPYAISRYEQVPNEVYGRSPAMDVLPAIKTLNEQKKTLLMQGHRAVSPVLLAHDDGVLDALSLRPGALNFGGVTKDGIPLVHALPVGDVQIGKELMDDERAIINDAFLVTLFQILTENPQMTATEVMERTREKGILMAPTIGRQQSEYLGSLIEREIDLLAKIGLIPPLPAALIEAKGEYRIEYDSPLSRSARAEEATGLMRTVETALNIANQSQNPAILDHFDWDTIIPEMSDIQGVPAKWRNSPDKIAQIREGRAQQMEQAQSIQAAPGVAALAKSAAVARKTDAETPVAQ